MKLLYLPNEPVEGWQVGARSALEQLRERKAIEALTVYSFLQHPPHRALVDILDIVARQLPDVILFTKPSRLPITDEWLHKLRAASPQLRIVYYDGDHYDRAFKRMSSAMRALCRHADLVFLCGLGRHASLFKSAGARNIRYLPHNASFVQFGAEWQPTPERELDVVLVGNRVTGRFRVQNRFRWTRMPGSYDREQLVRTLGAVFGPRFAVYGHGWDGFAGNRGPIAFDRQHEILQRCWVSVGYDHYPGTPFYFSDRLPIALMSGVAHIVHYHPGYETLFENERHLLWATSVQGLVETTRYALERGPAFLIEVGVHGRELAMQTLLSEVVYAEMIETIRNDCSIR